MTLMKIIFIAFPAFFKNISSTRGMVPLMPLTVKWDELRDENGLVILGPLDKINFPFS